VNEAREMVGHQAVVQKRGSSTVQSCPHFPQRQVVETCPSRSQTRAKVISCAFPHSLHSGRPVGSGFPGNDASATVHTVRVGYSRRLSYVARMRE
jgi:hypothetical protein